MKISDKCLEIVRAFEGFKAAPYLCPAGKWTIGYGSTFYEDGRRVSKDDPPITKERADDLMRLTLVGFQTEVNAMLRVTVTQGQFDALVDFAYNAGPANLKSSTLMAKVNRGDFAGAALEFDRWVYAGGVRLAGLTRRRDAEQALFEGRA